MAVEINLPGCHGTGAAVLSDEDNLMALNESSNDYVFCLQPGNYNQEFIIFRDCSSDKPCYLRTYDQNEKPWERADKGRDHQNAILKGLVLQGDYWVIDGVVIRDTSFGILNFQGAHHAVVNGVLVEHGYDMVRFVTGQYNTIQNSVLRNSKRRHGTDSHCIVTSRSQYIRILNNEIYNCTDGIHFYDGGDNYDPEAYRIEGTIVDSNEFYLTPDLYADCNNSDPDGSLGPTGKCACAEDALDFKVTMPLGDSVSEKDLVYVRNNLMYGFRKVHQSCGGSGGWGNGVSFHNRNPNHVVVENNIIFDLPQGITMSGSYNTIRNNIFYKINDYGVGQGSIALMLYSGKNNEVYHNTIIGKGAGDEYLYHKYNARNYDVRNNLFINAGRATAAKDGGFEKESHVGYNAFVGATIPYSNTIDLAHNIVVTGNLTLDNYCFPLHKFTYYLHGEGKSNEGENRMCLPVIPQASSPFVNQGDSQLGKRDQEEGIAIGVNDHVPAVKVDFLGNTRGDWPDMGAFEYLSFFPTPDYLRDQLIELLLSWLGSEHDQNGDGKVNSIDFGRLLR